MTFKFIHSADIHLDSPLRGLERYEGAPIEYARKASRAAFVNLVNLCLQEEVDFVLIVGDLYDGDWRDYNTGLFFTWQVSRLNDAGIKVVFVRGNHDAASQITKSLRMPENVIELSTERPETIILDELGVAIHGQGFATRNVTEDLTLKYPQPIREFFNIGLLHTSVDGRQGHDPYAPCNLKDLIAKGYDYWALGHVHTREILHDKGPWVVFPGNVQGRNVRETGPKGCTLVMVSDGKVEHLEHRDLDVLRWSVCDIDASKLTNLDDIVDTAITMANDEIDRSDGRLLAIRFQIHGATEANQALRNNREELANNLRSELNSTSSGEVWVEKVQIRTRNKASLSSITTKYDPVSYLLQYLGNLNSNNELKETLEEEITDLKRVVPVELFATDSMLNFDDENNLQELFDEVEQLVINKLLTREEFTE